MSLLLALLSSSPAFTDQAKGTAGASATALTTKAVTQSARASAGGTSSNTAKKAVTWQALASFGATGLATGTASFSGITTSAAGRFGATGTAYSLQATVTTGGGRKYRAPLPVLEKKPPRADRIEAVVAEIEGRVDTIATIEQVDEYRARLDKAVAKFEAKPDARYDSGALEALADAERLRGMLAARELILQAALNATLRAIEIEETDMAFVMAILSEA